MPGLHFEFTADDENVVKKLNEIKGGISSLNDAFESFRNVANVSLAGITIKEFIDRIKDTRGEFQQLEIAFKTMLGNAEQADALMNQLVRTAATTPFDLKGVADGAKQLLAYGIEAKDVNETLVRLGDIAAGLSLPLGDLVYLYGTTVVQGRMFTQDLRQFQGRGIPIAEELAKQFGVTKDKVAGLVTAGRVGAEEFKNAIVGMTSEGSKFGGLMEAQSKTITGQISNIEDALDMMFNDLGKQSEGVINTALSSVSYLVENYEKVGKVLLEIVSIYGSYKAAIIVLSALENARYQATLAMGAAEKTLTTWEALRYAWTTKLAEAQKALNAAMINNPFALYTAAVVAVGYGLYKLITYQTDAEKAQSRLNDAFSENEKGAISEQRALNSLYEKLRSLDSGTQEYSDAKNELIKNYSKYLPSLKEEIEMIGGLEGAYSKLSLAISKANAQKGYQKFMESELDSLDTLMSENLGKIQNKLYKKLGEEEGAKIYSKVREAIISGAEIPADVQAVLNTVQNMGKLNANSQINGWISDIRKAQKELDNLDKKAKVKFGISEYYKEAVPEDKATTATKETTKDKTYWENQKKKYEGELEALDIKEKGSKKWQELEAKIRDAKSKVESYSVESDKKLNQQREKQLKTENKIDAEIISMMQDSTQDEINLMKESTEKKIAQTNLNFDKQIAAINKQKKEWEADQKGKLTEEQSTAISDAITKTELNRQKALAKIQKEETESQTNAMNEYLKEYGTYQQRRLAIAQLYADKIAKATTEGEKMTLSKQRDNEISELDIKMNKATSSYSKLFGDMKDKSVKELRALAAEGGKIMSFFINGQWDAGKGLQFGISEETYNKILSSPEELEKLKKVIKEIVKEADDAEPAFEKVADGLEELFSSGNDSAKLTKALQKVQSGVQEIGQTVSFVSDAFGTLGDALGSDVLSGIADGLGTAMDVMNSTMQGAQAGAMFGPIGAAAGAALGAVTSLVSAIAKIHDAKNEKRIQKLQDQIDALDKAYDDLGDAIDDAYSTDASELIDQQNTLLKQQKLLIQQQIKEEEDKKKTDKDRIKDWQEQIEEIDKTISENEEKAVDAIFGSDVQSAIEDFAEAYADAWDSGTDRAKSAKDTVKSMIKSMIQESIKAAASDPMKAIREKLLEYWSDSFISEWEQQQIESMATDLQEQLDKQFGWADRFLSGDSSTTQEASSKAFASMSEETGEELNGRFTAFQESNESIKNQMIVAVAGVNSLVSISSSSNVILSDILKQHALTNGYLEDIAKYTKPILDFGGKFDKMVDRLNRL